MIGRKRRARRAHHRDHDVRLARWSESIRTGLWFVPTMFVAGTIVLALGMIAVDHWADGRFESVAFGGDSQSAQQVLSTIASSTMTFTGLVFSITIVALQLSSTQFSPRVLRTFLRDRGSQVALGLFVATFVYALLVLRAVRSGGGEGSDTFVPALSVTVAFLLVMVSLGAFVYYVNHIAQSIRVVSIIESVAHETRAAIEDQYPAGETDPGAHVELTGDPVSRVLILDGGSGAVVGIDEDDLVEVARHHHCLLRLLPSVGDYVPRGTPLFEVYGPAESLKAGHVLPYVGIGRERTMHQDVAFGFRQLVDIAEKALSPSINDPTTAVQALDRLHDFLRTLATRPVPSGRHLDEDGELRLVHPVAGWNDLVTLAVAEIRQYGVGHFQVARRLRAALCDLLEVAPPERRDILERQLALLDAGVRRSFADPEDRALAGDPDQQGMGG